MKWILRAFVLALVSTFALAQKPKDAKDVCPYCNNDPAVMEKAGIVNHGPFAFGEVGHTTADAASLLAMCDIKWIQSKHFEIGFAIGPWKVKDDERKAIRAELERLAVAMPKVDPKQTILDPWLRAHLTAQRCEDIYNRVCEVLQVDDSLFPDGSKPWDTRGKYMGEGPFLGEKGKFEILITPSEAASVSYLKTEFGLNVKKTQRWNIVKTDTLTVVVDIQDGSLREDKALHGHLGFNLTINMLDAYKHYNYETPIWIREGMAHFIEREINPKYNTFDSSEGSVGTESHKENWENEVKKLIASGHPPVMAELMSMKDYSDLTLARHYAIWSMVEFLVKTNPKGWACLQDAIHGRTNAKGFSDGSGLDNVHREKFKECLGFATYQDFEAAWAAWVAATYTTQQ